MRKAGAAAGGVEDVDFDAAVLKGFAAVGGGGGGGDDGEVAVGGGDEVGGEGDAEGGVEDDAQEGAGAAEAGAVGEAAIVGEHGADAGEDGVGEMADLLDVGAGALAGDPAGVVLGRGDFAVEGEGGFEGDQRTRGAHGVEEGFVERGGFGFVFGGDFDFDAGLAEAAEAFARDGGIGIGHGGDDAGDAGGDDRICAGAGASGVGAGFEGDVEGCAAGALPGFVEGEDFSVFDSGPGVGAAADDTAVAHDDRAHRGVGAGAAGALAGERHGFVHEGRLHLAAWAVGANRESMKLSGSNGSRSEACSPTPM